MGQKIKATIDGEDQEFELCGDREVDATHIIASDGTVLNKPANAGVIEYGYLRLVRKQHTFGGLVFEEIQTANRVKFGEWYQHPGGPPQFHRDSNSTTYGTPVVVLRPVAIEEQL